MKLKEFAFLRKRRDPTKPSDGKTTPPPGSAAKEKEKGPLDVFAQDQEMFHKARDAPEDVDAVLPLYLQRI